MWRANHSDQFHTAQHLAHFAVKSIGMSRVNGRKPCTLLEAARHNLREIQAEQGANSHIDPQRTRHNAVLAGPATAEEVRHLASALLEGADISRLKRDHVQAIEAMFSLPPGCNIDAHGYFDRCVGWLTTALPLPVLSAVFHCDESAPHLHVLMLPVRDGRHVGGSPIVRPQLKRLREEFFAKVAGPAGLKRDSAKLRGTVKQWAVNAVLRECGAMGLPAANGPLWNVLLAAIERDPTAALMALNIDVNAIRPDEARPIGLDPSPIGLHQTGDKVQALSCVGLPPQPVICDTQKSRLSIAHAAQQHAIDRHTKPLGRKAQAAPTNSVGDGFTRVKDEFAQACPWD